MHFTCFACSFQMITISSLKSGTPRVSVALVRDKMRSSIADEVSFSPRVRRLQCLESSVGVTDLRIAYLILILFNSLNCDLVCMFCVGAGFIMV